MREKRLDRRIGERSYSKQEKVYREDERDETKQINE